MPNISHRHLPTSIKTTLPIVSFALLFLNVSALASWPEFDDISQKLFTAGRLERCIELANRKSVNQQDFIKCQTLLALSEYMRNHYLVSITAINKVLLSKNNNLDNESKGNLLALRGSCYYQLHSFDKALEDFTNAMKTLPDNPPEIAKSIGQTYQKLGNKEKASQYLRDDTFSYQDGLDASKGQSYAVPLVEISPAVKFPGKGNSEKWQQAKMLAKEGEKLESENQLDKAINKYNAAIELYSYDPGLYAMLGLCYSTRKDYEDIDKSISAFKQALTLDNSDWRLWNDLGSLLNESNGTRENALAEAKQAYQTALTKGSDMDVSQKQDIEHSIMIIKASFRLGEQMKSAEQTGQFKILHDEDL